MTTRQQTLLNKAILAYLIAGATALYVAVLLAPVALIAVIVCALR